MVSKNPLKGQIQVINGQQKLAFGFEFAVEHAPEFGQTLLMSFASQGLTPEEKRLLTRDMRAQLALIQNVPCEELDDWSAKLCVFLNGLENPDLGIKASGLGAHICMAALLGGHLVRHKRYSFQLEEAPLALFPHKKLEWAKTELVEHEVILSLGRKDWLSPFKSLYQFPVPPQGLRLSYASQTDSSKRRAA